MSFRLSPKNLCMSDAMPWQQHYEARIAGRDINDVLTPHLFIDVRANLKAGDEVMVCGYSDQTWKRLTQFVRLRIYAVSADGVEFMRDGEVIGIPLRKDEPAPKKAAARELDVAKEFGGGFNVIDKKTGHVLEKFKTKKDAEQYAGAYS